MSDKVVKRVLDRRPYFDIKSRQFPVREVVAPNTKPRSYSWRVNKWLDQGQEGACVGFGWTYNLIARPKEHLELDNQFARKVYSQAKLLDDDPDNNSGQDTGTTVLAGAKALQKLGYIKEYRWAFNLNDIIIALGHTGPVVLGMNWYDGMFDVDEHGFIHPTGGIAGGHCILAHSVNLKGKYITLRNSWGENWGIEGDCKISFDDLTKLMSEQGEACIAIGESNVSKS